MKEEIHSLPGHQEPDFEEAERIVVFIINDFFSVKSSFVL